MMDKSLFDGFTTGIAVGAALGGGLLFVLRRQRFFDERAREIKRSAATNAFKVGLLLLFAAWIWTEISPSAPAAVVLFPAIFALEMLAFVACHLHAARRS